MSRAPSSPPGLSRRALLGALVPAAFIAAIAPACTKRESNARCKLCGMKLDLTSPWRAELASADGKVHGFDTPRCALTALRRGTVAGMGATLRVQEFYDRTWATGDRVDFVVGSDVLGPMGPDLVPVDKGRSAKFAKDHGDGHALALDAVTLEVIDAIK